MGRDPWGSCPGEGQIPKDLAPRGGKSLRHRNLLVGSQRSYQLCQPRTQRFVSVSAQVLFPCKLTSGHAKLITQCKKFVHLYFAGKAGSFCRKDSDCNKNLCCASSIFGQSKCMHLGKEKDDCANMFGGKTAFCPCMEGLECRKR